MHANLSLTLSACLLGLWAAVPADAQLVNRKIENVAVVPAAQPGLYDVHVVWTAQFPNTAAGLDTSTELAVLVGPNTVKIVNVDMLLDVATGVCGFNGCTGGCGGGYIDGVFNTLLCLKDPPTCTGGNCDCACQYPWITSTIPSVPLPPGAPISVVAKAMAGAFPDVDMSDNTFAIDFDGKSIFWDRGIEAVELIPTAQKGKFDVKVAGFVGWHGLTKDTNLSYELQLEVNGLVVAMIPQFGLATPPGPGQETCNGSPSICNNGCGGWNGGFIECELMVTYPDYLISCSCGTPWITYFSAIPLEPDDEVKVVFIAGDDALPALPDSGADDLAIATLDTCDSDFNNDDTIDGADLGALLAVWGPCAGCDEDLNNDNTVDGADLGILLAAWGDC
jgi:hypothetical protein